MGVSVKRGRGSPHTPNGTHLVFEVAALDRVVCRPRADAHVLVAHATVEIQVDESIVVAENVDQVIVARRMAADELKAGQRRAIAFDLDVEEAVDEDRGTAGRCRDGDAVRLDDDRAVVAVMASGEVQRVALRGAVEGTHQLRDGVEDRRHAGAVYAPPQEQQQHV